MGWLLDGMMIACAVPDPGSAADPARADGPAPRRAQVAEIVVTGDRPASFAADLVQAGTFRNARLLDQPTIVDVIPRDLLQAQAAASLYDAARNTAGVTRSMLNGGVYDNLAIRGIPLDVRTSYRLNGSLPIIDLIDLPLENKERVEALKGIATLFYGYAPPSGIVDLVTRRPTGDSVDATASITDHGAPYAAIDVSRRITDRLGIRVNGAAGIVATGVRRVNGARHLATLAADWAVSTAVTARLDVEHIEKDVTETPAIQVPPPGYVGIPPAAPGVIALPPIPDPAVNLGGRGLRYAAAATNVLGRVDVRLAPQLALTVEAGQASLIRDRALGQIGTIDLRPGSPGYGTATLRIYPTRGQLYRNRNARAELSAAFATGPVTHELVAGVTANWRYQNNRQAPVVTTTQNLFAPRMIVIAPPTRFTTAPLAIRDDGAYLLDRATLGPVALIAGVRYSDYHYRATAADGTVSRLARTDWTPSAALVVTPIATVSLYASYSRGLEEGSSAPIAAANSLATLAPTIGQQIELGVKHAMPRGLVVQAAVFRIDRPIAFVDPVDNIFKPGGRSRYRGVEASIAGEIGPALSLHGSAQYLDARILSGAPAALVGRRPENTPVWTQSVYADYRVPMLAGIAIGGGAFHVGARAVNALNQAFVPGYTVWSAALRRSMRWAGQPVTVQLNVDNLTNARYWSAVGGNLMGVGLPRQIKLTTRLAL